MNREDWNLARRAINRTKIRWAISTFKPFKSAQTDEIVPVLLRHETEHLVWHMDTFLRLGDRSK
jgi:hypothetical protein